MNGLIQCDLATTMIADRQRTAAERARVARETRAARSPRRSGRGATRLGVVLARRMGALLPARTA